MNIYVYEVQRRIIVKELNPKCLLFHISVLKIVPLDLYQHNCF